MTSGDRSNPCRSLSPPLAVRDYRALDAEPKPEAALSKFYCNYFAAFVPYALLQGAPVIQNQPYLKTHKGKLRDFNNHAHSFQTLICNYCSGAAANSYV